MENWMSVVRRLRPSTAWLDVAAAVNAQLPAGHAKFSRDASWRPSDSSPQNGWLIRRF
jgi:hypothetical protein